MLPQECREIDHLKEDRFLECPSTLSHKALAEFNKILESDEVRAILKLTASFQCDALRKGNQISTRLP